MSARRRVHFSLVAYRRQFYNTLSMQFCIGVRMLATCLESSHPHKAPGYPNSSGPFLCKASHHSARKHRARMWQEAAHVVGYLKEHVFSLVKGAVRPSP
jgi:hypothetical protein